MSFKVQAITLDEQMLRQNILSSLVKMLILSAFAAVSLNAQPTPFEERIRKTLQALDAYRYGDISVFEINQQGAATAFEKISAALNDPIDLKDTIYLEKLIVSKKGNLLKAMRDAVTSEAGDEDKIEAKLTCEDCEFTANDLQQVDAQKALDFLIRKYQYDAAKFKSAYVVTTKYSRGMDTSNFNIVGLITSNEVEEEAVVNLGKIKKIYSARDLMAAPVSDEASAAKALFAYIKLQIQQGNLKNVTLEVQGIDNVTTQFVKPVYGVAKLVPEDSVQQYIKITNGIPVKYVGPNEVTISLPDLIAYRRYASDGGVMTSLKQVLTKDGRDSVDPETKEAVFDISTDSTYNSRLPLYGFELRYGLEDINYPSIWSERVSLNAVWSQARLGVILPTSPWSSLSNDLGSPRTMTRAGFGVNANVDVPVKIIDQSGVFNVAASYVFDDAVRTDRPRFDELAQRSFDHLVRFHAQLQYTFAVTIDEHNFVRMRLGGTAYQMERWTDIDSIVDGKATKVFSKYDNEFIGGVSGKIEFMNTNWSTPLGASLQYFDESILINTWLQFQASPNLGFRIDANLFTPVFRDARAWENNAVFMPSLRAILNF